MKLTQQIIKFIIIALISLAIISCSEKDENALPDNHLNVSFSVDTIETLNGVPNINETTYWMIPVHDTLCNISFSERKKDWENVDGGWRMSLYIPKSLYLGNGVYNLEEFEMPVATGIEKPYILFEEIYNLGVNSTHSLSLSSNLTDNQSGHFELYNVKEFQIGIKFNDIKLTDWSGEIFATSSCNVLIKEFDIYVD